MGTQLNIAASAGLVALTFSGAGFAQCPPNPVSSKPAISFALEPSQATIKSGSALRVTVVSTNVSKNDVILWRNNVADHGGVDYRVEVRSAGSNLAPETRVGRLLNGHVEFSDKEKMDPLLANRSGGCFTLEPGKSFRDNVNVSRLYDIRQPGTYSVRVEQSDPVSNTIDKSNTTTVTVIP